MLDFGASSVVPEEVFVQYPSQEAYDLAHRTWPTRDAMVQAIRDSREVQEFFGEPAISQMRRDAAEASGFVPPVNVPEPASPRQWTLTAQYSLTSTSTI